MKDYDEDIIEINNRINDLYILLSELSSSVTNLNFRLIMLIDEAKLKSEVKL